MQTILGAGGAIANELAKHLTEYTTDIRLVGRNPKKVNPTDSLFKADLTDSVQIFKAVEGSEVVYLTVGFEYVTKTWQSLWLPTVTSTIAACEKYNAKLVFFDNVYAIGGDNVQHITEQSPISPSSKKGEVRAAVDRLILEHIQKGTLQAIIARAPDFFGPQKEKSILMNVVYDNLAKGKTAQWLGDANKIHTTGYAPELAKGTAILGNTPDAFNQIWNLPVSAEKLTGKQWVQLFAEAMGAKSSKVQALPGWGQWAIGWFVPFMKEMYEMNYQYDRDYFFDSSKFNKRFNYTPISNKTAVQQTVAALKG